MNKTIIVDNFLEEETFNTIKNTANGDDIKWVTQLSNSELKDFTFFDMGEMIREKDEWLELKNTMALVTNLIPIESLLEMNVSEER